MKASEVYLQAAKKVSACTFMEFSCNVIDEVVGKGESAERKRYWDLFYSDSEWDVWTNRDRSGIVDLKDFRVLALCLMAAIAADEERTKS